MKVCASVVVKTSDAGQPKGGLGMDISIPLQPLVSLLAGLLILIMPSLLNYVVAVYLIVIGVLGLLR